jgi:hypothetical protein
VVGSASLAQLFGDSGKDDARKGTSCVSVRMSVHTTKDQAGSTVTVWSKDCSLSSRPRTSTEAKNPTKGAEQGRVRMHEITLVGV